jgi:hypothetical protein
MDSRQILELVDKEKTRCWLQSVCVPTLVAPSFFEKMGFPSWFVGQFLRKQRKVLLLDGTVQRGVRGVSELDFLWGLADAIGADTSQARRMSSVPRQIRICAEACISALDQIDGENRMPGVTSDGLLGLNAGHISED